MARANQFWLNFPWCKVGFGTNHRKINDLVLTVDQEVGGSNPPSCTSKINRLGKPGRFCSKSFSDARCFALKSLRNSFRGFGTQCCEINKLTLTRNCGADVDRSAIAQEAAEADEVAATIATLEASLSFVQQEAEVRRKATKIELGNRVAYLEAEGKFLDQAARTHCRGVLDLWSTCLCFFVVGPPVSERPNSQLKCAGQRARP